VRWDDWIRTVEVEPSIYAADFADLGTQIEALLRAGARVFHWDVGDGHFVEPITMGPIVLRSISGPIHEGGGFVDVHLMVERPERHFGQFAEVGADSVTVHYEAVDDVESVVHSARSLGLEVGLAVKPKTGIAPAVEAALDSNVDFVLCMSVEPGYSGQEFIPESLDRLRMLRQLLPEGMHLQVDGGINAENIRAAHEAGADLLVAASAIFGREDLPRAFHRLVQALA
jgi:ribulose-phosphate 3-epimerase